MKCLNEKVTLTATHESMRRNKYRIYDVTLTKNALTCVNDKTWIEDDGVTSRLYGYKMGCGYEHLKPKDTDYVVT